MMAWAVRISAAMLVLGVAVLLVGLETAVLPLVGAGMLLWGASLLIVMAGRRDSLRAKRPRPPEGCRPDAHEFEDAGRGWLYCRVCRAHYREHKGQYLDVGEVFRRGIR